MESQKESQPAFVKSLLQKSYKVFKWTTIIRAVLTLLTSKFNLKKAAGEYSKIIRFGIASALYGIIFKMLRCFLAQLRV